MKIAVCLVLSLIPATVAAAQGSGRYRFAAGDTLRYHVQEVDSSALTTPQGRVPITTMLESTVRLAVGPASAIQATFTQFRVGVQTPQGLLTPAESLALHREFSLVISDRGVVTVTTAPKFPDELTKVVDPSAEFDDYFLVLPSATLQVGVSWVDTVKKSSSTAAGQKISRDVVASYVVARDTVIRGRPGLVITTRSQQSVTAVGPGPGPGLTVTNQLTGTEQGLIIYDPARGRMLARQRVGDFTGTLHVDGGPSPVDYPLERRYLTGLELQP
ncbi:MAG TPA: hypothetical protein VJN95_11085 [Gemmatimonadales bacterium]|nr:hypothetical protein [Gemmatimonadales bacterium]